jgi:hypothetical protein
MLSLNLVRPPQLHSCALIKGHGCLTGDEVACRLFPPGPHFFFWKPLQLWQLRKAALSGAQREPSCCPRMWPHAAVASAKALPPSFLNGPPPSSVQDAGAGASAVPSLLDLCCATLRGSLSEHTACAVLEVADCLSPVTEELRGQVRCEHVRGPHGRRKAGCTGRLLAGGLAWVAASGEVSRRAWFAGAGAYRG